MHDKFKYYLLFIKKKLFIIRTSLYINILLSDFLNFSSARLKIIVQFTWNEFLFDIWFEHVELGLCDHVNVESDGNV